MASPQPRIRPFVLCILDGWGIAAPSEGNAVHRANTPNWDRFHREGVVAQVEASSEAVGLPPGQMGNSEVGHLNIGAGRIVFQDIVRIDRDIREGRFAENPVLKGAMEGARAKDTRVHLIGLTGPGGVHSHERHMFALLEMARDLKVPKVQVHALLDGRDTQPQSAIGFLDDLEAVTERTGATIGSVIGRYYAMDRDKRWERVEKAYRCLVHGEGERAPDAKRAVQQAYERGENDEFVLPTVLDDAERIAKGDTVIFVNFRPDRARELTRALAEPGFGEFDVVDLDLDYVCMTRYQADFEKFAEIAYPPEWPKMTLGEHLSKLGMTQLRIAETEKYAHVTYFFSGGGEDPFPGESRILVPSPKIATYDLQPEMSAPEVTERLIAALQGEDPPHLVVLNYANPDMVGHTGFLDQTIRAVETIDTALGQLERAVKAAGGALMITADHGNCEEMLDATGGPVTKHTTNPVPLVLVGADGVLPEGLALRDGILADVAPTILDLLGLEQPKEMDRESLAVRPTAS